MTRMQVPRDSRRFRPAILIAVLVIVWPMQGAPARPHTRTGPQKGISLPTLATVLLVGYAIGGAILEAAARNWSGMLPRVWAL